MIKFNLPFLIMVFVIIVASANSTNAVYGEYTCAIGVCNGCTPVVMCDTSDIPACTDECYRTCGLRTNYRSDLNNCQTDCAGTWCAGAYSNDKCKKACESTCDMNGQIYGLVDIAYGIAAGIAALMIIFHALKWMISEEPAERKEARERIIYVLFGVIIIIIAIAVVNVIYSASISRCA